MVGDHLTVPVIPLITSRILVLTRGVRTTPLAVTTLTAPRALAVVDLPVRGGAGRSKIRFPEAEHAEPGGMRVAVPAREAREIRHDVESQKTVFHIESDDGRYVIEDTGTEIASKRIKIYEIGREAPTSAVTRVICSQEYRREGWNPRVETEVKVACDETHFHITGQVRAFEGEEPFAARDFKSSRCRVCSRLLSLA